MDLDYTSLLIAVAVASFAILVAALASWTSARKDKYLMFDAIGVGLFMVALVLMSLRNGQYDIDTLLMPFILMHAGAGFVYAGTRSFFDKPDMTPPVLAAVSTATITTLCTVTGLLGLTFIALNIGVALVLFLCGYEYLSSRYDFRGATVATAVLYFITAASFVAPAVPEIISFDPVTYPKIDTFLDTINAILSLVGMTGIGALTLTLHFSRVASKHHADAQTDPLTGVLNRRAMFERFAADGAIPGQSVLVFDLDYFKSINDHLGHAQGDKTLQYFGDLLRLHLSEDAMIARIGGEEFCAVLPISEPDRARAMAETVRFGFAALGLPSGRDDAVATVSIGVATGGLYEDFESVLGRADAALYASKRAGRNKVRVAGGLLAA